MKDLVQKLLLTGGLFLLADHAHEALVASGIFNRDFGFMMIGATLFFMTLDWRYHHD